MKLKIALIAATIAAATGSAQAQRCENVDLRVINNSQTAFQILQVRARDMDKNKWRIAQRRNVTSRPFTSNMVGTPINDLSIRKVLDKEIYLQIKYRRRTGNRTVFVANSQALTCVNGASARIDIPRTGHTPLRTRR